MMIKEARKRKNMTQKELADKIGVDYTVISRYEKGIITPPATRLQAIAETLDVTTDYLIGANEDILVETYPAHYGNTHEQLNFDSIDADRYIIHHDLALQKRIFAYAAGLCELCQKEAPFLDNAGNPYLEIHHIQWLSEGGSPCLQNTVALCPNCHRKMHILNDKEDLQKLKAVAEKHQ